MLEMKGVNVHLMGNTNVSNVMENT